MLRNFAVLFVLASFAALTTLSDAHANIVKKLCADRWPGDYAQRVNCVEIQSRSVRRVAQFLYRYDIKRKAQAAADGRAKMGPYTKMYLFCGKKALVTHNDTIDYVKFASCLNKREKAYKSLHPDGK